MNIPSPTVFIEEVMGRAHQGVTKPFICRGEDGHVYYTKGFGAGRRSLICEWVAAQLATRFGLPIADYALAEVPAELILPGQPPDLSDLGSGLVFASRELPHVQELNVTTRARIDVGQATDVLVFDWWLKNEDRHLTELGGNPKRSGWATGRYRPQSGIRPGFRCRPISGLPRLRGPLERGRHGSCRTGEVR